MSRVWVRLGLYFWDLERMLPVESFFLEKAGSKAATENEDVLADLVMSLSGDQGNTYKLSPK